VTLAELKNDGKVELYRWKLCWETSM